MNNLQAARAYADVGLTSKAMSASPHQLIVMLFDGALAALRKAGFALAAGDVPARGMALSKAIDIIDREVGLVMAQLGAPDIAALGEEFLYKPMPRNY